MKSLELLWARWQIYVWTYFAQPAALFPEIFAEYFFFCCSFPRIIFRIYFHKSLVETSCTALSQKYFRIFFHHKLLVETSCAALSPVVCLFLLSVGLVPVDRQRHKRDSFFSLDNMSLVALLQPITRWNCSNKDNLEKMPGGNYQGTLWTLLVSWFFDRHHKESLRLKFRQELKEMQFRKNNWH